MLQVRFGCWESGQRRRLWGARGAVASYLLKKLQVHVTMTEIRAAAVSSSGRGRQAGLFALLTTP